MFFILRVFTVFAFKMLEELLRLVFRSAPRPFFRALTPQERVLRLEARRQAKGYQAGWLYHRCREEGLLEALHQLRSQGHSE